MRAEGPEPDPRVAFRFRNMQFDFGKCGVDGADAVEVVGWHEGILLVVPAKCVACKFFLSAFGCARFQMDFGLPAPLDFSEVTDRCARKMTSDDDFAGVSQLAREIAEKKTQQTAPADLPDSPAEQ